MFGKLKRREIEIKKDFKELNELKIYIKKREESKIKNKEEIKNIKIIGRNRLKF